MVCDTVQVIVNRLFYDIAGVCFAHQFPFGFWRTNNLSLAGCSMAGLSMGSACTCICHCLVIEDVQCLIICLR